MLYEEKEDYDLGSDKLLIHKFNDIYENFYEIKKDINNKISLFNNYMDEKQRIISFIDYYTIDKDSIILKRRLMVLLSDNYF